MAVREPQNIATSELQPFDPSIDSFREPPFDPSIDSLREPPFENLRVCDPSMILRVFDPSMILRVCDRVKNHSRFNAVEAFADFSFTDGL